MSNTDSSAEEQLAAFIDSGLTASEYLEANDIPHPEGGVTQGLFGFYGEGGGSNFLPGFARFFGGEVVGFHGVELVNGLPVEGSGSRRLYRQRYDWRSGCRRL